MNATLRKAYCLVAPASTKSDTHFWRSASLVLTGGAAFVGRAVLRQLRPLRCARIRVPRRRDFELTRRERVEPVFDTVQPNIVIHLACLSGAIGADRRPAGECFYQNLIMGSQVMDVARARGVDEFIVIGTVCVYPKYTPTPFRKDALWNGYREETNALYGLAKRMVLVQGQAYRQQYGLNAIYLLPVNLYGPGDNFALDTSHVIPGLIRKVVTARDEGRREVLCWGSGEVSREFLYVDDAARAILLAAEHYNSPDRMNIGSGEEIRIADLAGTIRRLIGYDGKLRWDASKPEGQPRRVVDTRRAREYIGFTPRVGLEDGLRRTITFYEQADGGASAVGT